MAQEKDDPQIIDIDVFAPRPSRRVKFAGEVHGVLHPLDLPYRDYLRVEQLPKLLKEATTHEQEYAVLVELVMKLIPTLTREAIEAEPLSKLGILVAQLQVTFKEPSSSPLEPRPNASN